MTREEIIAALRHCKLHVPYSCVPCPAKLPHGDCMTPLHSAAADLIENQQREIEALRQVDEGSDPSAAGGGYSGESGAALPAADKASRFQGGAPFSEHVSDRWTDGTTRADTGTQDDNEICRAALEAFGAEAQVMMAIEEMSELTKALCKHRRGRDNVEAIAEEIADVEIMLRQMMLLFDCREDVDKFCRYKLERLAGRIKEAKEHEKQAGQDAVRQVCIPAQGAGV